MDKRASAYPFFFYPAPISHSLTNLSFQPRGRWFSMLKTKRINEPNMPNIQTIFLLTCTLLFVGCSEQKEPQVFSQATIEANSKQTNELFEEIFMRNVMRSPVYQTYQGIKTDYDKWDDNSEARALENHQFAIQDLAKLNTINPSSLDGATQVSYRLMRQNLEQNIADFKWRLYDYPVNQMFGSHTFIPSFLINQHQMVDLSDAKAYLSRLNGVGDVMTQLIENLKLRADNNIIPPKFVFPHAIRSSENIISGIPFQEDAASNSALLADFTSKVTALKLDAKQTQTLIAQAKQALTQVVKPAYLSLIAYLTQLETQATTDDGVWKFKDGDEFYNLALQRTTTTTLSAKEIHQIGLDEVKRIHLEMAKIQKTVGFEGNLKDFMEFMKTDSQFYLADTPADKEKYLNQAKALINNMKSRLDELFIVKPKADIIVKAVEAYREQSAATAFYDAPNPDGSRPGIYYANLYDMKSMPTYQMEALAYHEGIPGHHMQIAISQELEGLPKFRKYGSYTAYIEGWGLYSEFIPKEMGLYADPYSDFGRLAMELWRACRLVVDTGIHAMHWTRQQGIDYYVANTPNSTLDGIKMVERHIVMPSQATAYKIGMLKILELREKAKQQLNDKFDIREFHDVVLKNDPLPLNVLEEYVDLWVAKKHSL